MNEERPEHGTVSDDVDGRAAGDVDELTADLHVGMKLEVEAFTTYQLPADAYIAKEVTVNETTFVLRDDNLRPTWAIAPRGLGAVIQPQAFVKPCRRPGHRLSLVAAALYALFSGWLLYTGFRDEAHLLPWLGGVMGGALGVYAWTHRHRRSD